MRNFIKKSKINNGNRFIFCRRENRRLNRYPFDLLGSINVKKKNLASIEWQLEARSRYRYEELKLKIGGA